jgi:hypothetical protein
MYIFTAIQSNRTRMATIFVYIHQMLFRALRVMKKLQYVLSVLSFRFYFAIAAGAWRVA